MAALVRDRIERKAVLEVRATLRQGPDGQWTAVTEGPRHARASGSTLDRCIASLRRALARVATAPSRNEPLTLIVETRPRLAGVAEAAEIMGWDKRRVITYVDRGSFPEPLQTLASGRVWASVDVRAFARDWHARQAGRARRGRR